MSRLSGSIRAALSIQNVIIPGTIVRHFESSNTTRTMLEQRSRTLFLDGWKVRKVSTSTMQTTTCRVAAAHKLYRITSIRATRLSQASTHVLTVMEFLHCATWVTTHLTTTVNARRIMRPTSVVQPI